MQVRPLCLIDPFFQYNCAWVLYTNRTTADHPHGGGRGKSKGNVHPVSPWGVPVRILSYHSTDLILIRISNLYIGQRGLQDSAQEESQQVPRPRAREESRQAKTQVV